MEVSLVMDLVDNMQIKTRILKKADLKEKGLETSSVLALNDGMQLQAKSLKKADLKDTA